MAKRFDLLVFDWDGTLMDSAGAIVAAIQAACRDLGIEEPPESRARHVIGLGLGDALRHAVPDLPEQRYPQMIDRYRHHYLSRDHELTLFAGAEQMIAELSEAGFMLDTLRRIIQDINAARDLNEALSVIVADVKAALHTDVCSVYMTDHLRSEYVLMATDGLRPGAVGKVRLKVGQGLIGLAASRAEPINVENAPAHPMYSCL